MKPTTGRRRPLYVLSEVTVIPVLLRVALGQRPVVLLSIPLLRISAWPLQRLHRWLERARLVQTLAVFGNDLPWPPQFPLEKNLTAAALHPVEDDLHEIYLPHYLADIMKEDWYPMKKSLSDYLEVIKDLYLLEKWLAETKRKNKWQIVGTPNGVSVIVALFEKCPANSTVNCGPLYQVLNGVNAISFMLGGLFWLTPKIRLHQIQRRDYRLACDRVSEIDAYMHRRVIDNPRELLIVDRNRFLGEHFKDANDEFDTCTISDAQISPWHFMLAVWNLASDALRNWRHLSHVDPGLFIRFARIPVKRQMFAAFFKRFRPANFWARDDYSIDHIIRTQEVRRIGARSLGVNHGLPLNSFTPPWREVDFDVYYAFGSDLYDRIHSKTWSNRIELKPVGTLQMKSEYRIKLNKPRPLDIGFFPVVTRNFEQTFQEAFKVARHFPDRNLYVKMKPNRTLDYMKAYRRLMREAPSNVVAWVHSDPYELLLKISYSICFTTLVAESLQFKVMTFTLDCDPSLDYLYYREFPGLTVPNGETVIRRVEDIESGRERYDFSQYNSLIRIDGPDIYDVIRSDIGLPPRKKQPGGDGIADHPPAAAQ